MGCERLDRTGRLRDRFCSDPRVCEIARIRRSIFTLQGDIPDQLPEVPGFWQHGSLLPWKRGWG
jgi:hypothetical protein